MIRWIPLLLNAPIVWIEDIGFPWTFEYTSFTWVASCVTPNAFHKCPGRCITNNAVNVKHAELSPQIQFHSPVWVQAKSRNLSNPTFFSFDSPHNLKWHLVCLYFILLGTYVRLLDWVIPVKKNKEYIWYATEARQPEVHKCQYVCENMPCETTICMWH